MKNKTKYEFTGRVWQHTPTGGWHFVSLPREISKEIRELMKWEEEGWGRLKAVAQVGNTQWDTAIWFDTKQDTYLLPLKAEIRRKEKIEPFEELTTIVWV